MSPDKPQDPFDSFDWSKQDGLNPQASSNSTPDSSQSDPNTTPPSAPPPPPPPPISQPTYLPPSAPSAPSPGTYYSNAQAPFPTSGKLAGTLTAFMVLQWVTFGYGVFGFCASIPGFFLNGSAVGNNFGYGYLTYILFSGAAGLASTIFAFLSANSIVKRKKVGIKYGWIEISISWASLAIGTIFSFFFLQSLDSTLSGNSSLTINAISSGAAFGCGIIFPLAKTILLSLPSTKESANRDLS